MARSELAVDLDIVVLVVLRGGRGSVSLILVHFRESLCFIAAFFGGGGNLQMCREGIVLGKKLVKAIRYDGPPCPCPIILIFVPSVSDLNELCDLPRSAECENQLNRTQPMM